MAGVDPLLIAGYNYFACMHALVHVREYRLRVALAAALYARQCEQHRRRRRRRRWWMKPWLRNRHALGFSDTLVRELSAQDPEAHRMLLGVDIDFYDFLLQRLEPRITRDDTNFRKAIPARTRLQIALRY